MLAALKLRWFATFVFHQAAALGVNVLQPAAELTWGFAQLALDRKDSIHNNPQQAVWCLTVGLTSMSVDILALTTRICSRANQKNLNLNYLI